MTTLPLTLAGHTSVDIPVTFIYPGGSVYGAVVRTATLTISATGLPDTVVQLAGEWQPGPARQAGAEPPVLQYFEPSLSQIVNDTFGWTTNIGSTGYLNDDSGNDPFGDEHVSNFWKAADASKPVTVTRIAAFTGSGLGALNWYPSSDATGCATQAGASCHPVLSAFKPAAATDNPNADPFQMINPADAEIDESMLPLPVGDSPNQSFSPGSTQFGLQLGGEFSDNSRNDETNDIALDHCKVGNNCGHHMRFFPVIDANGVTVPNTWIVAIDLGGLNNDFNDDVLVVEPRAGELRELPVAAGRRTRARRVDRAVRVGQGHLARRGGLRRERDLRRRPGSSARTPQRRAARKRVQPCGGQVAQLGPPAQVGVRGPGMAAGAQATCSTSGVHRSHTPTIGPTASESAGRRAGAPLPGCGRPTPHARPNGPMTSQDPLVGFSQVDHGPIDRATQ